MKRVIAYSLITVVPAAVLICALAVWLYGKTETSPHRPGPSVRLPMAGVTPDNVKRVEGFWARAKQEYYRSPEELQAQDAREIRKGLVYAKLMHGDPSARTVALTFDDGPHPEYTPRLLAILKKYNVRATFFVIGKMVEQYPNLVQDEDAAGHLVANHTYHHVNLNHIPLDEIALEWQACNAAVRSVLHKEMKYCRPPGGDYDSDVITAAQEVGLTTVLWTDDPGDYATPGDGIIKQRTLDRVGNGGIILLHDGVQETLDVLPQIIESLQKRGFRFVTAEEMDKSLHSSDSKGSGQPTRE